MKIAIRGFKDVTVIEQADILYCKADGRYTQIYIGKDRSILASRLLKDIESSLSGKNFCRIHHSYLINLNHVKRITDQRKLILKENIEVPIAKRHNKELISSIAGLNINFV